MESKKIMILYRGSFEQPRKVQIFLVHYRAVHNSIDPQGKTEKNNWLNIIHFS